MIKLHELINMNEIANDKVALFPGSFKPFHKGHYDLVMSVPADKIILFISTKEKHGLSYTDAINIINLYNEIDPAFARKVEISDEVLKYPSPVTAMYELLRSGKLAGQTLVLAKSDKDADDKRFRAYQKYADEGEVMIEVYDFKASVHQNDTIGSTKIMALVKAGKIDEALKFFPKRVIDNRNSELVNILSKTNTITEGGNVFDDVESIRREYIEPTMDKFSKELVRLFPNFKTEFSRLGSVGKKDISGDIDLGLSSKLFFDEAGLPKLEEWRFDKNEYVAYVEKFTKRARTATPDQLALRAMLTLMGMEINEKSITLSANTKSSSTGALFLSFPQYNERGTRTDLFVQIDMMVGDIDWLNFAYYSDVYKDNVKGLHRTQLLVALLANKGYTFSHTMGIKNKDTQEKVANTPEEAINLINKLYKTKLDSKMIANYFTLVDHLQKTLGTNDYGDLIDSYLKILEFTRADIPLNLQDEWLQRKDRLGLTGKFLPSDSKLKQFITESGVAGGDRIPAVILNDVVKSYYETVLVGYDKYISHNITGSAKAGKKDYGDIDLIINVEGTDKRQSKKDFARYLNSLSEDIIAPFRGKYEGRRFYISGELVSTLFKYKDGLYQVDNNISFGEEETQYKTNFLDMPAEKQGLLSGLVRVATAHEHYQQIFKRMGIKLPLLRTKDYRYEFVLSGIKMSLRRVKLTPQFKELERVELWSSMKWSDVERLLNDYDLNDNFLNLLDNAQKKLDPNLRKRVKGLFNSLVSIKSGERGTPKGDYKQKMIDLINKKL